MAKSDAKWVLGSIARVILMTPFLIMRAIAEYALRFLDRRLPGG